MMPRKLRWLPVVLGTIAAACAADALRAVSPDTVAGTYFRTVGLTDGIEYDTLTLSVDGHALRTTIASDTTANPSGGARVRGYDAGSFVAYSDGSVAFQFPIALPGRDTVWTATGRRDGAQFTFAYRAYGASADRVETYTRAP